MRAGLKGTASDLACARARQLRRPFAGALVALLLLASVPGGINAGEARTIAGTGQSRGLLLGAIKPDWRGADGGNSGVIAVLGPATLPGETYSSPNTGQPITGVEVDAGGNVVFGTIADRVLSYNPVTGALNWSATLKRPGSSGTRGSCPPANPVLSDDGAVYMGDDSGHLYQIAPQRRFGTDAPSGAIFADPHAKALTLTPKIGPDNTLYVGEITGTLYAVKPPADDGRFTPVTHYLSFKASGSTPTGGPYAGVASVAPFRFCGEAALNSAGDTLYVASSDTNPSTRRLVMGTLYALSTADLGLKWAVPLGGGVLAAVVYASPANTVLVADTAGTITAVDGTSGTVQWRRQPGGTGGFRVSPVLSPDGGVVYAGLSDGRIYAYKVTNGSPVVPFGTAGVVALHAGLGTSPIVDRAGNLYVMLADGTIDRIDPSGAIDWILPGGARMGTSENSNGARSSLALGADGALLAGGASQKVTAFNAQIGAAQPSDTPAGSATSTPTATPTGTPTPLADATATWTPTATWTATPTGTPTATWTPTASWTPSFWSPTVTVTWTPTPTSTVTPSVTPTAFQGGPSPVLVVHGTVVKADTGVRLREVVVGAFSDPASLPADQYQAHIEWGDGLTGTGEARASNTARTRRQPRAVIQQLYVISGSHTYHEAGIYPINVTISAGDGRVAYLTSIAEVTD